MLSLQNEAVLSIDSVWNFVDDESVVFLAL